eukprot:965855-Rhodomonas_salina.7
MTTCVRTPRNQTRESALLCCRRAHGLSARGTCRTRVAVQPAGTADQYGLQQADTNSSGGGQYREFHSTYAGQ